MPTLFVNKERVDIAANVPGDTPLLWILRDNLNLTGTKYGCGMALCGACTVHVDGQPTRSCVTPLSALKPGVEITTIEGLKIARRQGGAGGVGEARRAAMRLLPVGPDHVGDRAAREEQAADRRRHRRRDGGQRLPLRDLRAHPRRDQGSREDARIKAKTMNPMRMRHRSRAAHDVAPRVPQDHRRGRRRASRSASSPSTRSRRCRARARRPAPRPPARSSRTRSCASARTTRSPWSSSTSRWARASTPGLPTLVAEELDAAWSQVRVEGAPADAKRLQQPAVGPGARHRRLDRDRQLVRAVPAGRRRGARDARRRGRRAVEGAAPTRSQVKNGVVSHASGKKATFGELADAAAKQPVPDDASSSRTAKDFVYIGKHVPRTDSRAKSNGTAMFTQDVKLPDMLTAVVAHPPRFGAQGARASTPPACKAFPGVRYVVEIPTGVAVLATTFWAAKKGRDALKIDWDDVAGVQGVVDRYPRRVQAARRDARQGRAQRRRRRQGARGRREDARGDVRVSLSRACGDGADELRGQARRRPLRGLERRAVPDRRPASRSRKTVGLKPEQVQAQHALRRRQLRPAREPGIRLRARGGVDRQVRSRAAASPASRSSSCGRARTT